jgi:hypothetical protein
MVSKKAEFCRDCSHISPDPDGHGRHTKRFAGGRRTLTGGDRLDVLSNISGPKASSDRVLDARVGTKDFSKAVDISFINAMKVRLYKVE